MMGSTTSCEWRSRGRSGSAQSQRCLQGYGPQVTFRVCTSSEEVEGALLVEHDSPTYAKPSSTSVRTAAIARSCVAPP